MAAPLPAALSGSSLSLTILPPAGEELFPFEGSPIYPDPSTGIPACDQCSFIAKYPCEIGDTSCYLDPVLGAYVQELSIVSGCCPGQNCIKGPDALPNCGTFGSITPCAPRPTCQSCSAGADVCQYDCQHDDVLNEGLKFINQSGLTPPLAYAVVCDSVPPAPALGTEQTGVVEFAYPLQAPPCPPGQIFSAFLERCVDRAICPKPGFGEVKPNPDGSCPVGAFKEPDGCCFVPEVVGPCPDGGLPPCLGNVDPPLPLASDGIGFSKPSNVALPVHPVLSEANIRATCGACGDVAGAESEEAEL